MSESQEIIPQPPPEECPEHIERMNHFRQRRYVTKSVITESGTQKSSSDHSNNANASLIGVESDRSTSVPTTHGPTLDEEPYSSTQSGDEGLVTDGKKERKTVLDPETAAAIDRMLEESRANRTFSGAQYEGMLEVKRKKSLREMDVCSYEGPGGTSPQTSAVGTLTDKREVKDKECMSDSIAAAAAEYLDMCRTELFASIHGSDEMPDKTTGLKRKDSIGELEVLSLESIREKSCGNKTKTIKDSSTITPYTEADTLDEESDDEDEDDDSCDRESSESESEWSASDDNDNVSDPKNCQIPPGWDSVSVSAQVELEMIKERLEHFLVGKLEKFNRLLYLESLFSNNKNQEIRNDIDQLVSLIYDEIEEEDDDGEMVVYPLMSDANEVYEYWDLSSGKLVWKPPLSRGGSTAENGAATNEKVTESTSKESHRVITLTPTLKSTPEADKDKRNDIKDYELTAAEGKNETGREQSSTDVPGTLDTSLSAGRVQAKSSVVVQEVADEIDGFLREVVKLRGNKPVKLQSRSEVKCEEIHKESTANKLVHQQSRPQQGNRRPEKLRSPPTTMKNPERMVQMPTINPQRTNERLLPKREKAKKDYIRAKPLNRPSNIRAPVIKDQLLKRPTATTPRYYNKAMSTAKASIGESVLPSKPMKFGKTAPVMAAKKKDAVPQSKQRKTVTSELRNPMSNSTSGKTPVKKFLPEVGNSAVNNASACYSPPSYRGQLGSPLAKGEPKRKRLLPKRQSQSKQFQLEKQSVEVHTLMASTPTSSKNIQDPAIKRKLSEAFTLPKLVRTEDGEGLDATAWIKAYRELKHTAARETATPRSLSPKQKAERHNEEDLVMKQRTRSNAFSTRRGAKLNRSAPSKGSMSEALVLPDISERSLATSGATGKLPSIQNRKSNYERLPPIMTRRKKKNVLPYIS